MSHFSRLPLITSAMLRRFGLARFSLGFALFALSGALLGSRSVARNAPGLALSVNFAPGSGPIFTIANPTIQVSGCDTFYAVEDAIITVNGNGVSYTTQPPGSGNCATSNSRRFDVTAPGFTPGTDTIVATVFNANGDSQTATAIYTYNAYAVVVTPSPGPTVAPGTNGTVSFNVANTGGTDATADLSVSLSLAAARAMPSDQAGPLLMRICAQFPGHAAKALGEYGGEAELGFLRRELHKATGWVKKEIERAIRAIQRRLDK